MRRIPSLLLATAAAFSAAPSPDLWLRRVEPVITSQERQRYLGLDDESEREAFRAAFWNGKAITADEYFERVMYADARFASGEPGSGANTDQGRVHIALGPPTHISQLPSSRILQPLEIWRYDHVPGLPVSSEIQLLFFQPRGVGFLKLYSPQLHTIRALLINNAGTRGAFPVNDIATADDLYNRIKLSPAEMEAVDAAMSVARGVKGSGNSELLFRIQNPASMLRRDLREKVQSRILTRVNPPIFETKQYRTADRIPAIDIIAEATVQSSIGVEVPGIETVETKVELKEPVRISWSQRLYLLPGTWTMALIADGQRTFFTIHVKNVSDADPEIPADQPVNKGAQWLSIGRQYLRAGDLSRARVCLRKGLEASPDNPDVLAGQGRFLAISGKLDDARDALSRALATHPNHYEALVALAGVTARFQDYEQALIYYRQAQAIRPSGDVQTAIREVQNRLVAVK